MAAPSGALRVSASSGGRLSTFPALFAADGSVYLLGAGDCVRVYAAETGALIRTLVPPGRAAGSCRDPLRGFALHPGHPRQVIVGYASGTLLLWDYEDAVVIRDWSGPADSTLVHFAIHPLAPGTALLVSRSPAGSHTLNALSLAAGGDLAPRILYSLPEAPTAVLLHESLPLLIALCPCGIFGFALDVLQGPVHIVSDRKGTPQVAALHPRHPTLAVGHGAGRIHILHLPSPLFARSGPAGRPFSVAAPEGAHSWDTRRVSVVAETFHWHAHAVLALAYTPDGSHLLSGGEEAVLVVWQLDKKTRDFLPRLGGPILHVSSDPAGTSYATVLGSNQVQVLRAIGGVNGGVKATTMGLKALGMRWNRPEYRVRIFQREPHHGGILINGSYGKVQVWDWRHGKSITEIDVAPHTVVSRTDSLEQMHPHVHLAAFSDDGAWMGTVDVHLGPTETRSSKRQVQLKFWKWDAETQRFGLNTLVQGPHGTDTVSSLVFCPSDSASPRGLLAMTTGEDGYFRTWTLEDAAQVSATVKAQPASVPFTRELTWLCRSSAAYQGNSCTASAFSADGSLAAVGFGPSLTLWNAASNALVADLSCGRQCDSLLSIAFSRDSAYLVALLALGRGSGAVSKCMVWNLLTCAVVFEVIHPGVAWSLAMDEHQPRFALSKSSKKGSQINAPSTSTVHLYSLEILSLTASYSLPFDHLGLMFVQDAPGFERPLVPTDLGLVVLSTDLEVLVMTAGHSEAQPGAAQRPAKGFHLKATHPTTLQPLVMDLPPPTSPEAAFPTLPAVLSGLGITAPPPAAMSPVAGRGDSAQARALAVARNQVPGLAFLTSGGGLIPPPSAWIDTFLHALLVPAPAASGDGGAPAPALSPDDEALWDELGLVEESPEIQAPAPERDVVSHGLHASVVPIEPRWDEPGPPVDFGFLFSHSNHPVST